MKLKHEMAYYATDQGIKDGDPVVVWGQVYNEISLEVRLYQKFDKFHWAGGMVWKNACPVIEPHEVDAGQVPVEYGDVWLKVYTGTNEADKAAVADAALVDFKDREVKGDFKK